MAKNYTIRAYVDTDYDFVYETKKNVYHRYVEECWGEWNEEKQKAFFVDFISAYSKDIKIIMVDGERAGFYHCELLPSGEFEIGNICIVPDYQGKGIGTEILNKMNRRYTKDSYLTLVDKIREKMPNARITSDFIVGFPTETEEEFEDTMRLVDEVKYDSIFAFMYSPREGTVASKMDGQIDQAVKQVRVNKLLALEKKIQQEEGKK